MAPLAAEGPLAALLGDVVAVPVIVDRPDLADTLSSALTAVSGEVNSLEDLRAGADHEFWGTFPTVGEALYAGLLLRLRLPPTVDIRVSVGWGGVSDEAEGGSPEGPAWAAARAGLEWIGGRQVSAGWETIRSAYRPAQDTRGPSTEAISAALLVQDHLLASLDTRSRHILDGLLHGRTQARLAQELGLTRQAINQRRKHDGLAIAAAAAQSLRSVI